MKIKNTITQVLDELIAEGKLNSQQYNDDYRANVEWGDLTTPTAQFHCVTDRVVDINSGIWNETAKILVFFGEKCHMEESGDVREEKIERMMDVAKEFISKLINRSDVSITSDKVMLYSIFSFGDSGVTGVKTDFELIDLEGECI